MRKPTRISTDKTKQHKTNTKIKSGVQGPRLEYNIPRMSKFVEDRGIDVLWEESFLCPCRSGMTRSPDTLCPLCHGRGVAFRPAKNAKVVIQSQDRSVSNTDLGLVDSGTAIGTTEIDSRISFRDRISLPKVEIEQAMLLDIKSQHITSGYRLPYDVKDITYAVTNNGEELCENEDFRVDYEENVVYPDESLTDKKLSLKITTTLRYIVIDLLKESRYQDTNKGTNNETFHNLPRKLLLKREDAWVNPIPTSLEDTFSSSNKDLDDDKDGWDDPKRDMNTGGFFLGGY